MLLETRDLLHNPFQVSLGPEQAAIAQSQHFDELESLWNKVSPPRRRSNKVRTEKSFNFIYLFSKHYFVK